MKITKILSLLLAVILAFSMTAPVMAAEEEDSELSQLLEDIQQMMVKYGPEVNEEVNAGTRKGTALPFQPAAGDHLVALGDDTARGKNTYVAMLADSLGMTYKNLARQDLLLEQLSEMVLTKKSADIKKADVITLGFSINGFATMAVSEILNSNSGETYMNWSQYVPAEGVAEIKSTLARMESYLISVGMTDSIPFVGPMYKITTIAAESFAYGALVYAHTLPKVLDELTAMNPTAKIIVLGMDNPMAGSVIALSGGDTMDLGGFIGKLINMTNRCAQTTVMGRENVCFVSAADAQNANDGRVMAQNELVSAYLHGVDENALPTQEGHAYIRDRILGAMQRTGDADLDGEVTYLDAMLALRAAVGQAQLDGPMVYTVDIDGDNAITYLDAMHILRASVGLEAFE